MATSTAEKMRIQLVVDSKANKVLFAEAGKDFVDFLIGLLTLPLSSAIRVLASEKMAGSLGELYESVGKLDDIYLQSSEEMANALRPTAAFSITPNTTPPPSITYNAKYYTCGRFSNCSSIASIYCKRCPYCEVGTMSEEVFIYDANRELAVVVKSDNKGYVERAGTYMVMDDLVVQPLSTNTLKKFEFHNSYVKEMAVDIGVEKGLELLRVSIQSKTVLTDVFLSKNNTTPGVLQIKGEH